MNSKKIIVGVLAGAVFFYSITSFIVDRKLTTLEAKLVADFNKQLEVVAGTAVLLGQGGVTEAVANIVPECNSLDMAGYDTLLSSLDRGLSAGELGELKGLFDRCGDNASARRAVMTLILAEQVRGLQMLTSHYESLGKKVDQENLLKDWTELVALEQDISNNFNQLVVAQGNIIGALVSATPSSALTVENIRVQAEAVRGKLTELTSLAAPLRSRLVKS